MWYSYRINRETSCPKKVSVATIIVDPRKPSKRHYHQKSEEIYYIIEGEANMEIEDEIFELKPGHAVLVPIGKPHQIKNMSKKQLKFLSIDAPIFDPNDVIIV